MFRTVSCILFTRPFCWGSWLNNSTAGKNWIPGDMGDIAEDEALEIPPEAPHGVAQLFVFFKKCPEKRQEDEVQIVQPKPVPQALDEFTGCLLWGMKLLHERQLRIV